MPGEVVGEVSIKVRPDTKKFSEELRAELKKINDDFKVDIGLNTEEAKAEFKALKERIEQDDIKATVDVKQRGDFKKSERGLAGILGSIKELDEKLQKVGQTTERQFRTIGNHLQRIGRDISQASDRLVEMRRSVGAIVGQTATWVGQMASSALSIDQAKNAWTRLSGAVRAVSDNVRNVPDLARLSRDLSLVGVLGDRIANTRVGRFAEALGKASTYTDRLYNGANRTAQAITRLAEGFTRIRRTNFSDTATSFRTLRNSAVSSTKGISSALGDLMDGAIQDFGTIASSVFRLAGQGFTSIASSMGTVITAVTGIVGGIAAAVVVLGVLAVVVSAIGGVLAIIVGLVVAAVGAIVAAVGALPPLAAVAVGIFAAIKLGMQGIQDAAKTLQPEFNRLKAKLDDTFRKGLTPVFERLRVVFGDLQTGLDGIAHSLVGFATGLANAITSEQGLQNIRNAFAGIQIAMDKMAPGLGSLLQSLLNIAGTQILYQILGDTIGSVAQKFGDFFDRLRIGAEGHAKLSDALIVMKGVLDGLTDVLTAVGQAAFDFFVAAGPGIADFFKAVGDALSRMDWASLGRTFGDMFKKMADAITNIDTVKLNVFLDSIGDIATKVADFAQSGGFGKVITALGMLGLAIAGVMDFANTFLGWIDKLTSLVGGVGPAFDSMKSQIETAVTGAAGTATQQFKDMWSGITGSTTGISSDVETMSGNVQGSAQRAGDGAAQSLGSGMAAMVRAAAEGVNNTGNEVGRLPGVAQSSIGPTGGILQGSGESLVDGFIAGIRSMISRVASAAQAVVAAARQYFPFSPAKKGPFSGKGYTIYSGRALATDFAKGIEDQAPRAVHAVENMMQATNQKAQAEWNGQVQSDSFGITGSVFDGVMAAFNGSRLQVDGNGMAKLVNKTNTRNSRR